MKRLINTTIGISIIGIIVIAVYSCGGGEDEAGKAGGRLESGGETSNPGYEYRRAHVCVLEMNFRTEPSADATRVTGHEVLYWGIEFDVLKEEGDWVRVRLDDGTEGWLRAEYEGQRYISYSNMSGTERRMDSDEFLEFASVEARKWDPGADLAFLCGSYGGLDGKCHCWRAFYKSPAKPGKKMMCMLGDVENEIRILGYDKYGEIIEPDEPHCEPGQGLFAEEWDEDWAVYGASIEDGIPVGPGPAWWRPYQEGCETGGPFIPTYALCSDENVAKIISTAKKDIREDLGAAAEDNEGFIFVIDENRWKIIVPKVYEGDYVFVFGAADGRFVEFRDETFEY
jgi:hypothetical protein